MPYEPYKNLTSAQIRNQISTLKYELKHLKPERSGQASNYYAPAIHYLEQELKRRGEDA